MYYSAEEIGRIRELKSEAPFTGFVEQNSDGEECKIKILGRGEVAFYQQGSRALLMEVLAGHGVIFAYSIRRWDDNKKVTEVERELIVEIVSRVMSRLGAIEVRVVKK